jgi:REP element-mobilizing transposase RayT
MFPSPPPGFDGLDLNRPVRRYVRHLPHWRQDGATYFVTFRLADSLPEAKMIEIQNFRRHWEYTHPEPRSEEDWKKLAHEVFRRTESWLDDGHGACHFRESRWINELHSRLQHFNGQRYQLSCSVIMPNHCHLIIRPFDGQDLEDILGVIKGITARQINGAIGNQGELWQQECYDRIVRDLEHLRNVIQYIGRNPMSLRIPRSQWPLWIDPAWEQCGWGFGLPSAPNM